MTAWNSINPNQLLPASLVSAVSTLANLLDAALADVKSKLSVTDRIPSLPDIPNTTTAVVTAVLDTLEKLLSGGRVHVLVIPISKSVPKPQPSVIPPTVQDLQDALGVDLGTTNAADAAAYARMVEKSGGNAGFYAAFSQSLMDLSDANRPQYDGQRDAVAMTTVMVGAPTFAAISSAASTLEALLEPKDGGGSLTARVVPVPQSLKGRAVATASGQGIGVRLDWDPPKDAYQARYFPGVTVTVKRYAVIRSTDAVMQSARSVWDLFSTATLVEGMTNGPNTVIKIGSGRNAAYLDESVDLETPAYYAIAWECAVREEGQTATLAFDKLSPVVKVMPRAPTPPQTGQSPDWTASPRALDVIPGVSAAATSLIEQARVLLAPSSNPTRRLSAAASLVTDASARISARVTSLSADLSRLAASLSRPIPSLYVTRMSSGTGGNAFLLAELAKRLGDTTDAGRPPFDHGEYVCGVCFVAGASRLADLASAMTFFDSLFGSANAENPLLGVLAAVDTLVTQAETRVFGPDMQPVSVDTSGSLDPLTGQVSTPPRPAISDEGIAVPVDDPDNPAAGDTNITPLSELC